MKINLAGAALLDRIILRRPGLERLAAPDIDLANVLRAILAWANGFVPSESGSILLDEPGRRQGLLHFVACYGKGSETLAGTAIPVSKGIVGVTYKRGEPYISRDVTSDRAFHRAIAERLHYPTRSIICAPIRVRGAVIGVIEMINRKGKQNYSDRDLVLLEIFAGYTANYMENALAAREFKDLSERDNLTGLYNDRYFHKRLEREVAVTMAGEPDTALIFFDLDHFKEVNDEHGHLAGSRVLKEIGEIVRKVFARTKAVMARYGGDEYVVVMLGTTLEVAMRYAEKLRAAIAAATFLARRGPHGEPALRIKGLITASIGVASLNVHVPAPLPAVSQTADALIRAADDAMYKAKTLGKNRVHVARVPQR